MRTVLAAWITISVLMPGVVLGQTTAAPPPRFALVVGVSDYGLQSLPNATRDAHLVEDALKDTGFQVVPLTNPTRGQLRQAVNDLAQRTRGLGKDATIVFYFAGHGVQFDGENYLVPWQTGLFSGAPAASDYEDQSVRAQWALEKLSETKIGRILLVLDACRTNPFRPYHRSPSDADGLAKMSAVPQGPDTMIVFAAEPRFAALDGPAGANSFFTRALAETIRLPGIDISEVFDIVRRRVWADTHEKQRPSVEGFFRFTFKEGPRPLVTQLGIAPERISSAEDGFELLKETLRRRTIDDLRRAAAEGDGFATYLLGLAYWEGFGGVSVDVREGVRWMRRAIARGVGRAATSLGYFHCCSGAAPKNDEEAVEWFRVGMELGAVRSIDNLGVSYRDGEGVTRDVKEAERLFLLAGERGRPASFDNAAWLYRDPQHGQVNMARAVALHQRAFDAGYLSAAISLAFIYRSGELVPRDVSKAMEYLRRGGEAGCAECWRHLGDIYAAASADVSARVVDPEQASAAYLRASEGGDTDAMLTLGRRLRKGEGVPADTVAGFAWAERARAQGNLEAIGEVGELLAKGDGVPSDPEKAARLLTEALAFQDEVSKRFKIYVVRYWDFGATLADLHATRAITNASDTEAARLYARYGRGRDMKWLTVPVQCGAVKTPFHVYIIDWEREEPPTEEQAAWLRAERGCTMPAEVLESFRKLYKIARDNKVSFADLTVYALGEASKTEAQKPQQ